MLGSEGSWLWLTGWLWLPIAVFIFKRCQGTIEAAFVRNWVMPRIWAWKSKASLWKCHYWHSFLVGRKAQSISCRTTTTLKSRGSRTENGTFNIPHCVKTAEYWDCASQSARARKLWIWPSRWHWSGWSYWAITTWLRERHEVCRCFGQMRREPDETELSCERCCLGQANTNRYEQQEFAISIDLWLHFQPTCIVLNKSKSHPYHPTNSITHVIWACAST